MWLGIMDWREAVLVVVGLEALLLVVGVGNILLILRRYRRARREGVDAWAAFEDGLALVLPRAVARLVVNEPRLLAALVRWTFRRTGLASNEFGYHKRSMLCEIMPLLMVAAPMELAVVRLLAHAFSPWEWLRWAILVLEIYAILWLLGLYASLVTMPHRLEEKGLCLRYGVFAGGFVPYIRDSGRGEGDPQSPELRGRPGVFQRGGRPLSGRGRQDRCYAASASSAYHNRLSQRERAGPDSSSRGRRCGAARAGAALSYGVGVTGARRSDVERLLRSPSLYGPVLLRYRLASGPT